MMVVTGIVALSGRGSGSKNAFPKNPRPFLGGFCVQEKISERSSQAGSPVLEGQTNFEPNANQQYGRQKNVRLVGLDDGGSNEDSYEALTKVAGYRGVSLKRNNISVCHRQLSRNGGKWSLIARFVRGEKKMELMRNKKNLKSQPTKIYLNVDVTPFRSIKTFPLRRDATIKSAQSVKEKRKKLLYITRMIQKRC